MSKICNNCGKIVDDKANFCPGCKSQSFRQKQEIAVSNNSDLIYKIFYWQYPEGYVLSKTKIISIVVFLIFASIAIGESVGVVFIALIIAIIVFVLGFALHNIIEKPSNLRITNNDYGLVNDFKHLLFYWQNREGYFVLSKTKVISVIIHVVFFILLSFTNPPSLFALLAAGFVFSVPAFIIGWGVHKLSNPNPQPKIQQRPVKEVKPVVETPKIEKPAPQKTIIPEYVRYQQQLDDLNSKFIAKEKSTRNIITKRFEPPQITYTRFIGGVEKSSELFKKHLESAFTLINMADEYSPRIASEIESKITILESITDKLDNLANELVINDDLSKKEDVDNLIEEMDNLIDSVHDYEY